MEDKSAEWLQSLAIFSNVPEAQLQWFAGHTTQRKLAAGEVLFSEGAPVDAIYIIVSGRLNLVSSQRRIAAFYEAGDVSGILPYSRMKAATSAGVAAIDTELLVFPAMHIRDMICDHYELTEALVHIMLSRVRDYTSLQQQNEKMMALGKLSAGLAHELNNPASAIVRDAQSLQKHLALVPDSFKAIMNIKVTGEQVDAVNDLLFQSLAKERPTLTLMQRSEREDELTDWLEEHDVADSSALAELFADFGFCPPDLDAFAAHIPRAFLTPVFKWVTDNIITDKMVGDIGEAAGRIATLIASIKSFTHMDRAQEAQYADIHTGIRNTLTMLGHKMRERKVTLAEHYDASLPPVKAMIGELNQVWTNLIDNAVDAMEGRAGAELRITTLKDGSFVRVTIADNGAGIPEDIRARIFDPFFTTKDIGKGTGLGLDVVQRIVQQHRGSVKVTSEPGRTEFVVCFPIDG